MAMFYLENKPHAKTKSGEHIATQNHYDYICREGKYEKLSSEREDLVYTASGNMPSWAESPKDFWTAAEKHRRVNGRAYREVKLALQEELSLEENIDLVNKFCDRFNISKDHAYSFAIHDKPAAFDNAHRNIHAHIMFDERIIEPQRPLAEEAYFGRYSEDKYGAPSGGYYKDRYFTTKDCTVDMRKAWAELVNEKFKEKGIDIQISEKSLKDQYYELKAQGKDDEAEYFNREPAPHMGKMYRNPKNVIRIEEYTRSLEMDVENLASDDTDSVYDEEEENKKAEEEMKKASAAEQKMIIFAADALMRRIAREIQEEKEAQKNTQKYVDQYKSVTEENREPIIVTVADITEVMDERAEEHKKLAASFVEPYRNLQKQIFSDKVLYCMAERDALGLDGRALKAACVKADMEEKKLQKILKSLAPKDPMRKKYMEDELKASETLRLAENKYNEYLHRRTTESDMINLALDKYKENRTALQKDAAELYKKQMFNEHQYDMYHARSLELKKQFAEDQIVYADRIPKTVERNTRLDGKTPLRKMETVFYKGSTYFILNKRSEIYDKDRETPLKAVRYGDFINQGKAPMYTIAIKLEQGVSEKGKPFTKVTPVGIYQSSEEARMYKVHNRLPKIPRTSTGKESSIPELTRSSSRGLNIEKAISNVTKSNMSAQAGKLIRFLPDDDEMRGRPMNEFERVEAEMKHWDNGMKLGGRFSR